jgi:hypothetical protein
MKKILGGVIILAIVGGIVVGWGIAQREDPVIRQEEPGQIMEVVPKPTPIAMKQEQVSPDGKMIARVTIEGERVGIWVADLMILTKRLEPNEEWRVPFNTWSPDNKYFFLERTIAGESEYWVMKATGEPFIEGGIYRVIAEPFAQAFPELKLVSVTGWASPTLLIINAKSENEPKISFWYEVPSKQFIRLSSYFY